MQKRVTDEEINERLNKIGFRIAVMSGKGGVGKSTITLCLQFTTPGRERKLESSMQTFSGQAFPTSSVLKMQK